MIFCQINASAPPVHTISSHETNSHARSSLAHVYEGQHCTITALIFDNVNNRDLEVF